MEDFTCKRCGEECAVDGEFPRFIIWCETCDDYAEGADEYAGDYLAALADAAKDRAKDEGWRVVPKTDDPDVIKAAKAAEAFLNRDKP